MPENNTAHKHYSEVDRKNGRQSTSISIKLKVDLRGEVDEENGDVNDKLKGFRAEGCFSFFVFFSITRALEP